MEWKTPPAPRTHGAWAARLEPLRAHPYRWASFGETDRGTKADIEKGRFVGVLPGVFEATVRGGQADRGELFVRYVDGEPCDCGCLR